MRKLAALLALGSTVPGCRPGRQAETGKARLGSRSLSVTIYSAPPAREEDEGACYYDDWYYQEEQRKRGSLGVANQIRIFARYFASDPDARPYGFGVVKDEREVALPAGLSEYRFTEIARYTEPETVHFNCLSSPGAVEIVEQNFEFDLVSARAVLEKYIDREIRVLFRDGGGATGLLLAADDAHVILATARDETEIIDRGALDKIVLPEIPGGLVTRPTLAWLVDAESGGRERVRVSYRTRGLLWEAGYTALLSPDERTLELSGVATIGNASGASYEDARLKLVAGELNLVEPMEPLEEPCVMICFSLEEPGEDAFEEKTFFEYHLYTLQRPCTILNDEVKQIELFRPVSGIPVRKSYAYYGLLLPHDMEWWYPHLDADPDVKCNDKVDVYLQFTNDKAAGLGMPLPAGPVRVFKRDPSDGEMELVGGGLIDHTPKDEEVELRLGCVLDITGERRQLEFRCDYDERWMEESVEIVLRNHKDEAVEVTVKETMYRWLNWEITECSCEYGPKPTGKEAPSPPEWHQTLLKSASGKRVGFEMEDMPLHDAIAFLKALTGAKIVLDPELDRHTRQAGITLKVEDLELPLALERIVEQAELECCVKDGAVFITDWRKLVEEREYDVSRLALPPWGIAEVIHSMLAPDWFAPEYGTSVDVRAGRLVVRQSPRLHRRIKGFLGDLSKRHSRTAFFVVDVPADAEKKISYTVRYTW